MNKFIPIILFFFLPIFSLAQNLTGTWEGDMGEQFLQVNIMQSSKGICGYTYDYISTNKRSYCRAYFEGTWNAKKSQLKLVGSRMIENSGSHILMRLNFNYSSNINGEYLIGREMPKSLLMNIMSMGMGSTQISLRKVSDKPTPYYKDMFKDCMEDSVKNDTVKIIPPPIVVKKDTVKIIPLPPPVVIKKDTVVVKPIVKVDTPVKVKTIETKMVERKKEVISTIKVNTNQLTIKLYDNGTIDGDTVSVFHNGKLLVSHQLLSTKAVEVMIDISKENPRHEIVLFAENLGSIPPNTALLIIQAGNKRYELRASADLSKNASLIFEYDPTVK
jgi:hypothetical protein